MAVLWSGSACQTLADVDKSWRSSKRADNEINSNGTKKTRADKAKSLEYLCWISQRIGRVIGAFAVLTAQPW